MFKKGTMNFYHMDANEGMWGQIAMLIEHINQVVQKVSQKGKSGFCCHGIDE